MDLDQEETSPPTTANMSAKNKDLLSTAMKRTSEWFAFSLCLFFSFDICFIRPFLKGTQW